MRRRPKQLELLTTEDLANMELERDFQNRLTEFMRLEGWQVYSIPDSRRASMKGYPDITAWRVEDQRLLFIELKREKGRVSEAQTYVLESLRALAPRIPVEVYLWRPHDWPTIEEVIARPT